jgi:hypothetical protein
MLGSPDLSAPRCNRMPSRLFPLLMLAAALLFAGCGGGPETQPASSSTDVNALLRDTFANVSKIDSATIDAQLSISGGGQSLGAHVTGPFQSQGANKLPKFQLAAALTSGGHSFSGGATWTGDQGFVALQGTQYHLSGLLAKQLEAGYQQALHSNQAKRAGNGAVLSALGIDFTKWLNGARNEGDAQTAGVDTIKLTGNANVPQIVDDLTALAGKAKSLNVPGSASAPQLTAAQRQQLVDSIKNVSIEVYTGKADRLLRRIVVNADVQDQGAQTPSHLSLDLTLGNVGAQQQIEAPKNAKPFSELEKVAKQLQGLGSIAGGSGTGSSSSPPASSADAQAAIEKYASCVEQAAGDQAKMQRCASLIGSG